MRNKYSLFIIFVFSLSCKSQIKIKENQKLGDAKWFFYSFSMNLDAVDSVRKKVSPLSVDLKLIRVYESGKDTIKYYFQSYYKDTLNLCKYTPINLIGVSIIRDTLFIPLYHMVKRDYLSNDIPSLEMKQLNRLLVERCLKKNEEISYWLQREVKQRIDK